MFTILHSGISVYRICSRVEVLHLGCGWLGFSFLVKSWWKMVWDVWDVRLLLIEKQNRSVWHICVGEVTTHRVEVILVFEPQLPVALMMRCISKLFCWHERNSARLGANRIDCVSERGELFFAEVWCCRKSRLEVLDKNDVRDPKKGMHVGWWMEINGGPAVLQSNTE